MSLETNKAKAIAFMTNFAATSSVDRSACTADATWWTLSTDELSIDVHAQRVHRLAASQFEGPGRFEIQDIIAEGEKVAIRAEGFQPLKNGSTYENQYLWLISFRDDRICSIRAYFDTALALRTFQMSTE